MSKNFVNPTKVTDPSHQGRDCGGICRHLKIP